MNAEFLRNALREAPNTPFTHAISQGIRALTWGQLCFVHLVLLNSDLQACGPQESMHL